MYRLWMRRRLWMRGPKIWNMPIYTFDSQHVFQSQRHCCLVEKGCHFSLTLGDSRWQDQMGPQMLNCAQCCQLQLWRDSGCILNFLSTFCSRYIFCLQAQWNGSSRDTKLKLHKASLFQSRSLANGSTQQVEHSGTLTSRLQKISSSPWGEHSDFLRLKLKIPREHRPDRDQKVSRGQRDTVTVGTMGLLGEAASSHVNTHGA